MYLIRSKSGDRLHITPQRRRQLRKMLRSAGGRDTLVDVLAKARRIDSPLFNKVRFSSRTNDGIYTILTAPLKLNGKKVYTVLRILPRHSVSSELEVKDEVQAVIKWDRELYRIRKRKGDTLIGNVKKRGIYLVERDRKPVYVGIAWKGPVGKRWRCRLATFAQLKIPAETERRYTIRVGTIRPKGTWFGRTQKDLKDLYETVERVLIRYLKKVRRYGLTNRKSRLPFTVAKAGVLIRNTGTKPSYLPLKIERKAGQILEIPAPARSCGCHR